MENENVVANTAVPVPEPVVNKKTFRPGSLSGIIQTILNNMTGEYNIKDVVAKYNEECVKLQEQPGNAVRNIRVVVTAMLKDGTLVKVSRGRWKKA